MKMTDEELTNTIGGAKGLATAILFGIAGLVTIIIGIIDGYMNPIKCRS